MTPVHLHERLEVATCIACGARSRPGSCPDGCTDQPLDVVAAADVDALGERRTALEARADGLRAVAVAFAADPRADWDDLRRRGHAALAAEVPPAPAAPAVVAAWGCAECGRIDAPQPCLDVCIRRPVLMADVSELEAAATALAATEAVVRELEDAVRMVVHTRPRPDHEARTREVIRERCRATTR